MLLYTERPVNKRRLILMKMYLQSRTQGQGPDLALLHGWGVNSGVWQPIATILEQHFRVTYIDLPGYGVNAQAPLGANTLAFIAEQVSACLPPTFHLMGWSLGGLIAQQIALAQPQRINKLLLVATSPKFAKEPDWPGIEPLILQAFMHQLSTNFAKTLDRFLAIQALGSDTAKSDIRLIKQSIEQYPMPNIAALQGGLQLLAQADLRAVLGQHSVSTHWMMGRLDSLVPVALAEYLAQAQPKHSQHIFQHASHAPFISHPEAFTRHLLTAIAR